MCTAANLDRKQIVLLCFFLRYDMHTCLAMA